MAISKITWCHCGFNPTCGYPGEGPVHTQEPARDLRITVLPQTMERYLHLQCWLSKENLPDWQLLADNVEALNKVLCGYIQHLHNAKAPYSYAIECLAASQMLRPELQARWHPAWRSAREWGKTLPVLSVLLAFAVAAWTIGWRRRAASLLLAFEGLLRRMEVGGALHGHLSELSLPCDLSGDALRAILAKPESKTATRTVKMQSIMVTDMKLIKLLTYVYGRDTPRALLCPGGLRCHYVGCSAAARISS
eukprot:5499751-Amphidinium_carterae.2